MSDPVTNFAIEDVLSSIRRLVSDVDRPRPTEVLSELLPSDRVKPVRPSVPATAQNPYLVDRFVLTPAFRVADKAAAQPVTDRLADVLTLVDPVAKAAATIQFQAVNRSEKPYSASESRSALELRIAELEAAVTLQGQDWEPDGSEETPVVDWANTPPESVMFASRNHPDPTVLVAPVAQEVLHLTAPLPDVVAEPQVSFLHKRPDPETEDDDLANEFGTSDDGDETGALADDVAAYIGNVGAIDEAALRRLVIEIVHEELQGTLGERITRNVRKLVRREIYRALSSPEFE